MPVNTRIQLRRGTAAAGATQWTTQVLYAGEVGYETDTGKFKIGDGTTAWNSLPYASVLPSELDELVDDRVSNLLVAGSGIQLTYNDGANSLTVAATGLALSIHNHSSGDITDFSSAVDLLIPVKEVVAGSGISVSAITGVYTLSLSDPTIQVADITDLTASAAEINLVDGSVANTVVNSKAVIYGSAGQIAASSIQTTGNVTVGGDLVVNGTTTTVNSTVVTIDDPIFTIGGDTAPGSDDNKDRGIEFRYHNGSSAKIGFFGYDDSTGKFTFIPDATNSSEVFSGTKGEVDANVDWSNVLNKPDPVITVTLTGEVTGTANATLTDLASGTVTVSTTISADSVALGTDTTGNYVASIANGSYITGGGTGSEGAALTLAVDATTTNTASKVVARDASGNFAAGTITASGLSNATLTNCVIDGGTP